VGIHAGGHRGVSDLEQERAGAAGQDHDLAVDAPGDRTRLEQPRLRAGAAARP
jgi:hypothetical protein